MKTTKINKLSRTDQIKIGIIVCLVPILFYFIKVTFFPSKATIESVATSHDVALTPSAPLEIDAEAYLLDNNKTSAQHSPSMQQSIDKLFSSLASTPSAAPVIVGTPLSSIGKPPLPPTNFLNPTQLPSLRATSNNGSQTFNGAPPESIMPSQQNVLSSISISGVSCQRGDCQASTNVGSLKRGDCLTNGEEILFVNMAGIKTNKRMIAY